MVQENKNKYDKFGRPIKKKNLFQKIFSSSNTSEQIPYVNQSYSYKERKIHKEVKEIEEYKKEVAKKYDNLDKKFRKTNPVSSNQTQNDKLDEGYIALGLVFLSFFLMPFGIIIAFYILFHYKEDNLKRELLQSENIARFISKISIFIGIIYIFIFLYSFSLLF